MAVLVQALEMALATSCKHSKGAGNKCQVPVGVPAVLRALERPIQALLPHSLLHGVGAAE